MFLEQFESGLHVLILLDLLLLLGHNLLLVGEQVLQRGNALLELDYLYLVLLQHLMVIDDLIRCCLRLHGLGPRCEAERRQRQVDVVVVRTRRAYHSGQRVAAKGRSQDLSELTVSIRNVLLVAVATAHALGEFVDDVGEDEERLVDVRRFLNLLVAYIRDTL